MNKLVKTNELFDCQDPLLKNLFIEYEYPWEILKQIKTFINELIEKGLDNFTEIEKGVFVGKNVKIHKSAVIESPAIIGDGTEIRPNAYLRGYVFVGKNCVIGNSSELKESILLDKVQVPHYNYVGNSILGNFAHMGAGSICSNLKADGKSVVIRGEKDYETQLRKVGAFLGDHADIGCGCVLNPGTIIGKKTSVYPLTSFRGVIPCECIVKSMDDIVKRKTVSGEKMKFIKVKNYDELSKMASDIISSQIKQKPNSVLGLATGSTPIGTYKELVKKYEEKNLDFSNVKTINLDEYVGLTADNEQSYRFFMNENLFDKINIDKKNTFVPNGAAVNLEEEAKAYDKSVDDFGGIDLQLLGIGIDGHIGFNEPDTHFTKETHIVELDNSTIEANARFFATKEEVPKQAITMGMKGIMGAKKILLIANGKNKKELLEEAMNGEITPIVPASILQLHNDVTVIYSEE